MSRRLLARGWALVGCACLATVTSAASCSSTAKSNGSTVSGTTLAIYESVPPGQVSQETQDVLSAEQLAFRQAGARAGKYTLKLVRERGSELSANARRAIVDKTTIAYLGEIAPGASADTLGITNAEDVLQVSPTDTAVELTRSTPAISNTPDRYYESLGANGRTFARVVPTDAVEARAVAARMQAMGIRNVYVASDATPYGAALKAAFASAARGALPTTSSPSADAVFYAGNSATAAAAVFNRAVSSNPKVALFAPSALAENSFAGSLSSAAQRNLYVSSPGFTSSDLTPRGRQFVSAFTTAYGHAPAPQAIFGYAAMAAVIHALQRAGDAANSRSTVVHDFFAIRNLDSVLGSFSIDKNGDTNVTAVVISRVKHGKLVPQTEVQGQG
jgi:branched-chain amino acid transport system substrate-binding protein